MKKIFGILLIFNMVVFSACEYKEFEVTYSETYPVCGDYYVNDYMVDANGNITSELVKEDYDNYGLYIYNKSFNPTRDSIWIDNTSHSATANYANAYKIKLKADTVNLTFNVAKTPSIRADTAHAAPVPKRYIEIIDSKIIRNEWPTPDSIYIKINLYDINGNLERTFYTAGHRKTGWENPEYSDEM